MIRSSFQLIKLLKQKPVFQRTILYGQKAPQITMPPVIGYSTIIPGLFQSEALQDYLFKSKRHRVAKLKRAKRKGGKKTMIT